MDVSSRVVTTVTTLCVVLSVAAADGHWLNDYDQRLLVTCPRRQFLSFFRSRHDNGPEDRQFDIACRPLPSSNGTRVGACSWTRYVNGFDEPVVFICPPNEFLSGIESYHENSSEDRRFRFRCCPLFGRVLHGCQLTGWLNNLDEPFTYSTALDRVVTGMVSLHDNTAEDRRFQMMDCMMKLGKTRARSRSRS